MQDLVHIREALYESGVPNEAEVSTTFKRGNDQVFHLAIAKATHNFVFIRMMHLHLDLVKEIREMLLTDERRKEMDAEHEAIYEAIAARNPVIGACGYRSSPRKSYRPSQKDSLRVWRLP